MFILDWLFPKLCIGCGFLGEYLCLNCIKSLKTKKTVCFYCEKSSPAGTTHSACSKKGPITGNLSLYQYSGLMSKIIHSYKYKLNQTIINAFLIEAVQPQISKIQEFLPLTNPKLIPVPLNIKRMRRRGFNQALTICNYLSKALGLQINEVLIKTRETQPQAGITKLKERKANIKGVFVVTSDRLIKKQDVIIIDDLVTTGATVNEIGKVLKKAGARRVYSFALARP